MGHEKGTAYTVMSQVNSKLLPHTGVLSVAKEIIPKPVTPCLFGDGKCRK